MQTSKTYDIQRQLDILLHPRVPPLLRSLPHVESLSLFRAEESFDEVEVREALGLEYANQNAPSSDAAMNVEMATAQTPSLAPTSKTSEPPNSRFSAPERPKETQQTLPPPPDPLPTSSTKVAHATTTTPMSTAPVSVQPPASIVAVADQEEDEEMPSIDMDSDSD